MAPESPPGPPFSEDVRMLHSPALGKYPKIVCLLIPNPGRSFLPPKKPLWGREEAGQEFDLKENTWGPKAQALCPCSSIPSGSFGGCQHRSERQNVLGLPHQPASWVPGCLPMPVKTVQLGIIKPGYRKACWLSHPDPFQVGQSLSTCL